MEFGGSYHSLNGYLQLKKVIEAICTMQTHFLRFTIETGKSIVDVCLFI